VRLAIDQLSVTFLRWALGIDAQTVGFVESQP
jgi:hypothetical protein